MPVRDQAGRLDLLEVAVSSAGRHFQRHADHAWWCRIPCQVFGSCDAALVQQVTVMSLPPLPCVLVRTLYADPFLKCGGRHGVGSSTVPRISACNVNSRQQSLVWGGFAPHLAAVNRFWSVMMCQGWWRTAVPVATHACTNASAFAVQCVGVPCGFLRADSGQCNRRCCSLVASWLH
jgi:hypothetical protein